MSESETVEMLQCSKCMGPVVEARGWFGCLSCGHTFKPAEAEKLSKSRFMVEDVEGLGRSERRSDDIAADNMCLICESEIFDDGTGHKRGCPIGPDPTVVCGACGEDIPVAELAQHMGDEHDSTLAQDDLEEQYVLVNEFARKMIEARKIRAIAKMDLSDIYAAVGYRGITGGWPESFDPDTAVVVLLETIYEGQLKNDALIERLEQMNQRLYGTTEAEDGA